MAIGLGLIDLTFLLPFAQHNLALKIQWFGAGDPREESVVVAAHIQLIPIVFVPTDRCLG